MVHEPQGSDCPAPQSGMLTPALRSGVSLNGFSVFHLKWLKSPLQFIHADPQGTRKHRYGIESRKIAPGQ
jgi:hypothetical protein